MLHTSSSFEFNLDTLSIVANDFVTIADLFNHANNLVGPGSTAHSKFDKTILICQESQHLLGQASRQQPGLLRIRDVLQQAERPQQATRQLELDLKQRREDSMKAVNVFHNQLERARKNAGESNRAWQKERGGQERCRRYKKLKHTEVAVAFELILVTWVTMSRPESFDGDQVMQLIKEVSVSPVAAYSTGVICRRIRNGILRAQSNACCPAT
ncbi:unnamed protein product [Sympodiomycopsis kandeliae]